MNKKIVIYLCLMLVVLTGCKTKNAEPANVLSPASIIDRTTQGDVVGSKSSPIASFGDSVPNTVPIEEQVVSEDSVINSIGSFEDITDINTQDWYTFTSSDYQFQVVYPRDYAIVELQEGTYFLTGEGVGDFFTISVLNDEDSITDGILARTNEVFINGLTFQLEEYETDYDSTILSYKYDRGGTIYRFTYEYYEGLEDMLDLFVKSVETVLIN